ncbi:uncharacterized protein LOC9657573 isoform X1 [Selaginella moellendorffii]|uniref:uncharacterized protein LOC9657573 isoform X1 n=1 Tax=Selaginella moellendorffii TaxID=88036 RepID=UPI000D1C30D5|nr:uncharacterized protein LOC9657573 isoform X1 [Selaginella moellendorffii]|eukprot:XP_024538445.1 uncharacterized protein LOC9657573 isoform X1 [Selaginella moellendorffii]
MDCACGNVALWAHCDGGGGGGGKNRSTVRRKRRRFLLPVCRSSLLLDHVVRQVPLASVGQLLATGSTAFRTVAPTASAHAVALMTFAQVAVTAAVAYGACILPQASSDPRNGKVDDGTASLVFDGVDVSDYPIFQDEKVQRAVSYAREAHAGQMRMTGDPYITHCIHTAKILAALVPQVGTKAIDTVVAGILHDVVDDTTRSLHDLRTSFGDNVADLVAGVSRLSYINQLLRRHRRKTAHEREEFGNGLTSEEVDSLRIMLLGMVNDPRVVLVKLADRLHNMRTIYALPAPKARAVAQETLAVWCSLASRLGVWTVKAELEDLCFAVLEPQTFRELRSGLAAMWSVDEEVRHYRKMTKREKRRALIYGTESTEDESNEEIEDLSMKDLLDAVIPFDLLSGRKNRGKQKFGLPPSLSKSKVIEDTKVALAALSLCEEALDKEVAISTPYIPGTEVTLSGRLKSLYSTHSKMKRKGVHLDQIYDARALRVVVGDGGGKLHVAAIKGCYSLLDVVHRLWMPISGEFDDYILNPKPSGYQSLHTAVRGPDGAPLEVQIRTQLMHEQAESGNAAHWLYKESGAPVMTQDLPTNGRDSDTDLTPSSSTPSKQVQLRYPALRIEGGSLRAAVVIRVDHDGKELLVAVSSGEAIVSGASFDDKDRWKIFAYMYSKVAKSWWFAPGHGDWDTCLEKYVLCGDHIYHKKDQFHRPLPTFLQLLELDARELKEYMEVMTMVDEGIEIELQTQAGTSMSSQNLSSGSATTRLNNKVKLLRSMLQWEKEVHFEAARHPDDPSSAVLTEVLVISWPNGDIVRMPTGSTVSDAAQRMGIDNKIMYVNGQLALPLVELRDGDVIEVRGG